MSDAEAPAAPPPREPLVGRGRAEAAGPGPESTPTRAIPRPALDPAGATRRLWERPRVRLGLGIVLVGALAIAWMALASRPTPAEVPHASRQAAAASTTPRRVTARTPSTTASHPTAVPRWVPPAIAATCRARSGAPPVTVVVDCEPGRGVASLRYRAFGNLAALRRAYEGRRVLTGGSGASACADGRPDERAWSDPSGPDRSAGRYRCTRRQRVARVDWTDESARVLARATRVDGDLRSLYAWWTTVPGPVASNR